MGWNLAELQKAYADDASIIPENVKGTLDMQTTIELIDAATKKVKEDKDE